eukprot:4886469-Prymnesium_polylepis.1
MAEALPVACTAATHASITVPQPCSFLARCCGAGISSRRCGVSSASRFAVMLRLLTAAPKRLVSTPTGSGTCASTCASSSVATATPSILSPRHAATLTSC